MTDIPQDVTQETADEFQTENILTVVGGHFVHDTFSAFISPLLPLLIEKLTLSLTLAGSLSVFMQLPSLLSVVIGYLADRMSVRYLVIFAPAVTASLVTLLGFMPTYWTSALLLFITGLSVMAFHAPAPAMIAHISGRQVGKGMSYFMAGGELGRTIGPLLVGFGVAQWGMEGLWRLMIFGWFATGVLYFRLKDVSARSPRKRGFGMAEAMGEFRRVFAPLLGVMIFRNFLTTALTVYLVVYLVDIREMSLWLATIMLALYELAGVGGALAGGTMSDRFGRKRVIIVATVSGAFLLMLFLLSRGFIMFPIVMLLGFTSLSITPVFQALVQDQLPENRATASGMFILYAFIVRALGSLLLGALGDAIGLESAYWVAAFLSLVAVPIVYFLPTEPT